MSHYPLQHISIRVPWHDAAWNGSVCACPGRNTSCLKLKNIFETKDELIEAEVAGQSIRDLDSAQFPPCVKERATFMADFPFTRTHVHPYANDSKMTHTHFRPTPLHYPAYGAAGLPFRWMMKKFVFGDSKKKEPGLVDRFPLQDVSMAYEPGEDVLGFETNWLQDHRNHRTLLDCFWNHIRPEDSLVFFYAKQIPLVEDTGRRVIVGVGRIKSIGNLTEYDYDGDPGDKMRSLLWNTVLMREAATMIVESLAQLSTQDDPGRPLDLFPRQLERQDEDAAPLVSAIWKGLEDAPVIPDATGRLRVATELWRNPRDNGDLARQWQALAGEDELTKMVHSSCLEKQRGSRLSFLSERLKRANSSEQVGTELQKRNAGSWFAAVASIEVTAALSALQLAEDYEKDCRPAEWNVVRPQLKIIPSNGNQLLTASEAVFAPAGVTIPGRISVSHALCEESDALRILEDVMKVKTLDDQIWSSVLLESLESIEAWQVEEDGAGWQTFLGEVAQRPRSSSKQLHQSKSARNPSVEKGW
jgi:hypothetical protein